MSDLQIVDPKTGQAEILNIEAAPDGEPEIQALPMDAWHRARGGRMVAFAGYHMPIQYDGIMAEHLWCRAHAGLFDVSHMGQLMISGDGARASIEAVTCADLSVLRPGHIRYSLLLADDGGVLADLMITNLGEVEGAPTFYLVVNGATKWDDIAHLRERFPDEVTINHLDEQALLAVQGPGAVDALARIVPAAADLIFMQGTGAIWQGEQIGVSRSGYTGEDGFEVTLPGHLAAAFADALLAQPEVKPVGLGARDSLRLEAGLPLYGHDLDPQTTPVMADLGFALSKRRREARDFPGAERIMLEREAGPVAKRVGLLVEGRQPVREGAAVVDADGSTVGRVTSGGFAPSLGPPIALAYVPLALAAPGTTVTLAQRGKVHRATVTAMPFIPHRYVRGAKP